MHLLFLEIGIIPIESSEQKLWHFNAKLVGLPGLHLEQSEFLIFFKRINFIPDPGYLYSFKAKVLRVLLQLELLELLQGLQRESKDCEKDHYKKKTRKPNNTKISSLVSVTISLKQIRRLPGARRSHFDVCFPGYNGGQAVPQHLDTAPAN